MPLRCTRCLDEGKIENYGGPSSFCDCAYGKSLETSREKQQMKPHEQAKAWREKRGLTLDQLADLTGYSVPAIRKFEQGSRNGKRGEAHSQWTWQRYQMACAGAEAQLRTGREFTW